MEISERLNSHQICRNEHERLYTIRKKKIESEFGCAISHQNTCVNIGWETQGMQEGIFSRCPSPRPSPMPCQQPPPGGAGAGGVQQGQIPALDQTPALGPAEVPPSPSRPSASHLARPAASRGGGRAGASPFISEISPFLTSKLITVAETSPCQAERGKAPSEPLCPPGALQAPHGGEALL